MQPEIFRHFAAGDYNCSLNDCHFTLIGETDSSDSTRREHCSSLWFKVFIVISTLFTLSYIFILSSFVVDHL